MTTRAAIYCRISKDREGAGLGVERQQADCRELAGRLGWTVAETFTDNDLSAYSGKPRPAYRHLLDAISAGRTDAVLCWHTDRLHRSPSELETYITVCEPRGVPTHCVKAGPVDLATPSGRLIARQLGSVARYESEHMSERIRRQKERITSAGGWTGGRRAFGYESDGTTVREDEAERVRDAVRRVLAGESVTRILREWQATVPTTQGGKWYLSTVRHILTNPRNAGFVTTRGEVVGKANWPPIITEDEWRAVTALLRDPGRRTYEGNRSQRWLGAGLYRCGKCAADMRSGSRTRVDGTTSGIYRCRDHAHLSVDAEPIDEYVRQVASVVLDEHARDLLGAGTEDRTRELHESVNTLTGRLDELSDAFGDGEISRREWMRQRERITAKLEQATADLAAQQSGSVLAGIADAPSPSSAFAAQSIERQRAIVDVLMVVTVLPGKPGKPPKAVPFDYERVQIEPRESR